MPPAGSLGPTVVFFAWRGPWPADSPQMLVFLVIAAALACLIVSVVIGSPALGYVSLALCAVGLVVLGLRALPQLREPARARGPRTQPEVPTSADTVEAGEATEVAEAPAQVPADRASGARAAGQTGWAALAAGLEGAKGTDAVRPEPAPPPEPATPPETTPYPEPSAPPGDAPPTPSGPPPASYESPPPADRPSPPTAPPDLVAIVPGRRRFHRGECRLLVGHQVEELTAEEAIEEGFTPCTACIPDRAQLS